MPIDVGNQRLVDDAGNLSTTGTLAAGDRVSGHPLTGAHRAGEFIVAQDGAVWVCTAAGTPGTWTQAGGGGGPGSDTTAVHVGETTTGSATLTGDVASATSHVGTVSPRIDSFTPGSLVGQRALTDAGQPDGPTFPLKDGRYAVVVGSYSTNCDIVDCLDPTNPVIAATFHPHSGTAQFLNVSLIGTHTLVLTLYDTAAEPASVIEVWDVATPTAPSYVATGTGPHAQQLEYCCPVGIGSYFVAGTGTNFGATSKLWVWDLTVPATPTLVGSLVCPATTSGSGGGSPASFPTAFVRLDASHVAVVDDAANFYIYSIVTPSSPVVLGSTCISAGNSGLALISLDGSHLLCQTDGHLHALNIAVFADPVVVGTVVSTAESFLNVGLAVQGTTAHVAAHAANTIETFDCSDPTNLTSQGVMSCTAPTGLTVLDATHLAVFCWDGILRILLSAVSAPYPAQLAGLGTPSGKVTGQWQVGSLVSEGDATANDHQLLEVGATATEVIVPDKSAVIYIGGVAYKVPVVAV